MAYQALYRTFRSQSFSELVGQTAVSQTLRNAILNNKTSHAYLFTGPRGTGKTSAARIFAKAVNCANLKDGEPCNQCQNCQSITDGSNDDVIEIDAASNNGVEEIRRLRDTVKFPPTLGKVKVYIIDEVHMLSTAAFNALLKTLEEPPSHVLFILATTEVHKVPATILSRTQRFDFKRIPISDIVQHLEFVLGEEKVEAEDGALEIIARASLGGMRDALSILDSAITFSDGKISKETVLELTGMLTDDAFSNYFHYIAEKDAEKSLTIIDDLFSSGKDAKRFVEDAMLYLRNLLLYTYAPNYTKQMIGDSQSFQTLKEKLSYDETVRYIACLNKAQRELIHSKNPQIQIEIATLEMIRGENEGIQTVVEQGSSVEVEQLRNEMDALKAQMQNFLTSAGTIVQKKKASPNVSSAKSDFKDPVDRVLKILPHATKEVKNEIKNIWMDVLHTLSAPNRAKFQKYTFGAATPKELVIYFMQDMELFASVVAEDEQLLSQISNAISRMSPYQMDIVIMTENGWNEAVKIFMDGKTKEEVPEIETQTVDDEQEEEKQVVEKAKEIFGDFATIHEE